jgi:hypothetical protein
MNSSEDSTLSKFCEKIKWQYKFVFLVSCPKGQVEKYVNVEAWLPVCSTWGKLHKSKYGLSTCPFGQLTKKSTCPTQSFSCTKKLIKIKKTRE